MALRLVTGVPGAGKSLFAVSKIVAPLVGTSIELENGKAANRRLVIGGVRDLLLEHEPLDVLTFDPESGRVGGDPLEDRERRPGEPPLDVPIRADNWWLWCQPGDYIVIDECQRLFRPMASGRKIPKFISMLETHRHYGVDFLLITQHPMLLHASVRNLIGQHSHVRRMFGGAQTVIYEWDHCTNPDRTRDATKRIWRHDKAAFKLYKSAEVHTKHKHGLPMAAVALAGALVFLPVMGYSAYGRFSERYTSKSEPSEQDKGKPTGVATASASPERAPLTPMAASAPLAGASAAGAIQPEAPASAVAWAGCITFKARCECIDSTGFSRPVDLQFCRDTVERAGVGAVPYQVAAKPGFVPSGAGLKPPAHEEPSFGGVLSLGGDPRAHVQQ